MADEWHLGGGRRARRHEADSLVAPRHGGSISRVCLIFGTGDCSLMTAPVPDTGNGRICPQESKTSRTFRFR